jgi:hypothetical protein
LATAPLNPQWKPRSLARHHRKRTTGKEAGYFEDLLGVSRGNKKGAALSFGKIMTQVKAHLIDCADRTRVVIFLCDLWSPDLLDEHLEELRAHHRRGVRFLFLLVGTPDRAVAPVAVDLSAAP